MILEIKVFDNNKNLQSLYLNKNNIDFFLPVSEQCKVDIPDANIEININSHTVFSPMTIDEMIEAMKN